MDLESIPEEDHPMSFSLKLVQAQYSLIGLKSSTELPVEPCRFLSSAFDNLFMFYQYILKT